MLTMVFCYGPDCKYHSPYALYRKASKLIAYPPLPFIHRDSVLFYLFLLPYNEPLTDYVLGYNELYHQET